MATVEIERLEKHYGDYHALKGVSFTVKDGEFVVLVGPSGCGKSTLLRVIAGLEDVGAGTIRIAGRDVTDLEPRDRDIAMVFQSYALYPHMTVRDNMAFSLDLRRTAKAEIDARVGEAARILGIEALLDRKPRALSGGQRQRVAMGRAIVRHPQAFLFDEPLSNLDATVARADARRDPGAARPARGDQRLCHPRPGRGDDHGRPHRRARRRADRAGRARRSTSTRGRPTASSRASSARRRSTSSTATVEADGTLRLAEGGVLTAAAGVRPGPVTVGIRPEDLAPEPAGAITGTVRLVERLGAETYVLFGEPGAQRTWRIPGAVPIAAGEAVRLGAPAAALHLFDPASGDRL